MRVKQVGGAISYRPEIDGLRALAVLPVIFFHAGFPGFSGGYVGVDVFFVISGYLITRIITTEIQAGTFSLVGFYERRARRILPALFLVMGVSIVAAWLWLPPIDMKGLSQEIVATVLFSSNILFWQQSGYFDRTAEYRILLHTWSLAVEEQFYIVFPPMFLLIYKLRHAYIVWIFMLIFLISFSFSWWVSVHAPRAGFFLLPARAWELLIGVMLAFHEKNRAPFVAAATYQAALHQSASIVGIGLIAYSVVSFDSAILFPAPNALLPTMGAALIIAFANQETVVGKLLSARWLVGLGLVSYSAYLWHHVLFAFARTTSLSAPEPYVFMVLSAASLLLAYASWRFVEKPFRSKSKIKLRSFVSAAMVTGACGFVFGLVGHFNDGYIARFSPEVQNVFVSLDQSFEERRRLVRADLCKYNPRRMGDLDDFLRQWSCMDSPTENEGRRIPVAITGDSHSADKVMALRMNGLEPLQMGGAACSVVPKFMSEDCLRIYEALYNVLQKNPYYEYLVISSQFRSEELELEYLSDAIDFWEKFGRNLVFFTSMPEFPTYRQSLARGIDPPVDLELAEMSSREEVVSLMERRGVHVVDTGRLFCLITENCQYQNADGRVLMVDADHLSPAGAAKFGRRLLEEDELFRQWNVETVPIAGVPALPQR